jgi:outer membrane immunogenic protein
MNRYLKKSFFVGFVSLIVGFSSIASATNWAGWYLGGDLGYVSADARQKVVGLEGEWVVETQEDRDLIAQTWSTNLQPSGASFSIKGGYLYQMKDQPFVIGGELDYTHLDLTASRNTDTINVISAEAVFTNSVKIPSAFSIRSKFGYISGQHFFYGILGVTQAKTQYDVEINLSGNGGGAYINSSDSSDSLTGYQLGVGYEFALAESWALSIQYIATSLEDIKFSTKENNGFSNGTFERLKQETNYDALQAGFNYRF